LRLTNVIIVYFLFLDWVALVILRLTNVMIVYFLFLDWVVFVIVGIVVFLLVVFGVSYQIVRKMRYVLKT